MRCVSPKLVTPSRPAASGRTYSSMRRRRAGSTAGIVEPKPSDVNGKRRTFDVLPVGAGTRARPFLLHHAPALLDPLAPLLLLLDELFPLLGFQHVLHVEDHQGARLLERGPRVLDR